MRVLSPAKINLCLDITGKLPNGYHLLDMIMQEVPLYDTIDVEKDSEISIHGDIPDVPEIEKTIVYKSAKSFFDYTKIKGGAKITIKKEIPDGAGLGGSSSNGTSVILALNEIYNAKLTCEEMEKIAVNIGADMPFFVKGGCAIAQGIGEILTPIKPLKSVYLLLVKPKFSINTKWAYSQIDFDKFPNHATTAQIAKAVEENDLDFVCENMFNMIEFAVDNQDIKNIKEFMSLSGAKGTLMTGSGSCTYGIFTDKEKAQACELGIKNKFGNIVNFTKLLEL